MLMGFNTITMKVFLCLAYTLSVTLSLTIDNGIAPPEIVYKTSAEKFVPRCRTIGKPLDLIIVMDSSGSLKNANSEEMNVIKDLINIVAVDTDATRVALVSFSGVARAEFHFNTFNTRKQVLEALDVIKPMFGITKIGNGLGTAVKELDETKGMRGGNVPKVAFLVSDGRTIDYPEDSIQAANLRARGVDVWAYGLGDYVAIEELLNVTNDVNKVVTKKNYPLLKQLFDQYKGVEVCEEVPVCIPGSDKPLDLMLVVDGSESVEQKFHEEISFVQRLINNVNVHPDAVRVAMVTYSSHSKLEFDFKRYRSNDEVRQHLLNIVSRNGTTKTQLALNQAYDTITEAFGARNDSVKKLVIVLTDGHSQADPAEAAKRLATKALVFAVALVPIQLADKDELISIANNDPNHAFTRLNLDQFELVFKNFVSKSCPGMKEEDTEPIVRGPTDVHCNENSLSLTVRTINPFVGRVYAVGYEGDPTCAVIGQNNKEISISLTQNSCGIKRTAIEGPVAGFAYNATLMIQFHPDVVTKVDQPLLVNCFAPSDSALQAIPSIKLPSANAVCTYTLRQYSPDAGCVILDAKVGDNIFHKWSCDLAPTYNFLVHSCEAVTDRHTINILDENGCEVDPYIFETPDYAPKKNYVVKEQSMFKFPGVTWIQFRCKISVCDQELGKCQGIIPPVCNSKSKIIKREAKFTDSYLQTVTVETRRINVLVSDDLKPVEKLQFCPSYNV